MRIILFGSQGTLGSSLTKQLQKKKYKLLLFQHRKKIKENKYISIINDDIINKKKILYNKSDILIYLAWGKLDNYFSKKHLTEELTNHYNKINKMIKLGLKNIICAGTCFEYGLQEGELSEKNLAKPVIPYAIAKDNLRKKLQLLRKKTYFKLTWLRIFYIYNNDVFNNNLWSKINIALKDKKKIFKMSSGIQKRDYVDVKKFCNYIIKIINKNKSLGIINISSGRGISIKQVVYNWKKKYKWKINFKFGELKVPKYEPANFWGCNNKLKNIL
jgi:dTDP-6-deoxy-L-talose 4-dehydrogenase (NAD+)